MRKFQPSTEEEQALGWSISDYMPASVTSKVAEAQAYVSGKAGEYLPPAVASTVSSYVFGSEPPTVYATVPAAMKAVPWNLPDAYVQAMYWMSLAIKRAAYDKNESAKKVLSSQYILLSQEAAAAEASWSTPRGLACNLTGYGCERKGRAEVLKAVYDFIFMSSLAQADKDQILPVLSSARNGALFSQALPFILLVGLGAAAGTYWMRRRA